MTSKRILRLLIVCGVFGLLLLWTLGFFSGGTAFNRSVVTAQTPFEFSWDKFEFPGTKLEPLAEKYCQERIERLPELVPEDHFHEVREACINDYFQAILIDRDARPIMFRDGELTVTVRDQFEPVIFNFFVGHEATFNSISFASSAHRRNQTRSIQRALVSLYGEPIAKGELSNIPPYFDAVDFEPYSLEEFGIAPTCSLWIQKAVGIIFCSEGSMKRQGIQNSLSLTYIKLDRVFFGERLACNKGDRERKDRIRCVIEFEDRYLYKYPDDSTNFLETLDHWSNRNFEQCQSDNLKPLNALIDLPTDIEAELVDDLRSYSARELLKHLGRYKVLEGLPMEASRNARLFLQSKAAEEGDIDTAFIIGRKLLFCEREVQQDIAQARDWLERASNQRHPRALRALALMHARGLVKEGPSRAKANDLLTKCAEEEPDVCQVQLRALKKLNSLVEDR